MKKLFLILFIFILSGILFAGCSTTVAPPVNSGEGEGEGEQIDRVVLVEFFTVGCPNCTIAEPIIEGLAEEYDRTEMILLELRPWGTPISPGANDRYEWYLPNAADRSTPNTFYNGSNQRIWHGHAYYIFKSPILNELAKDAKISITATRTDNGETSTISGKIKNLSSSSIENLVVNGMTFRDYFKSGQRYMVKDIFKGIEEVGESLGAGEERDFTIVLEDIQWEINALHGVVFVQSSSTKEVFQALYVE